MDNHILFGRPPHGSKKIKRDQLRGLNEPHAAVLVERKETHRGKGPYVRVLTDPGAVANGLAVQSCRRATETWPYGAQPYGNHCGIRGVHENGRTSMFEQAICEVAASLS